MNEIDEWIISKINKLIKFDAQNIQTVSWFPKAPFDIYTCAIRLGTKMDFSPKEDNDLKVVCIGNYINILISDNILVNQIIDIVKKNKMFGATCNCYYDVVIEHTSLTPVYPINMATFRSSVIGNALAHYYETHGAFTHVHYLVSDKARNVELVVNYINNNSLPMKGKIDHAYAWAYCMALHQIGKFNKIDELRNMFPKYLDDGQHVQVKDDICTIRNYCDRCIKGHINTLEAAKIFIDDLDYESDAIVYLINNFNDFVEAINSRNSSYLLSNIAYYLKLSCQKHIVYSVVSSRQQNIIEKSIELLDRIYDANIIPIYFNDVTSVSEYENVDVIRKGIFHSVDGYIDEVCKRFNVSVGEGYSALKLMFLSVNLSEKLVIDYETYSDIKKYIDILYKINHAEEFVLTDNKIMKTDVLLAKMLIISDNVYSCGNRDKIRKSKDFSCHQIVNYIISLASDVFDSYIRINKSLLECVLLIINNGLELLGVIN